MQRWRLSIVLLWLCLGLGLTLTVAQAAEESEEALSGKAASKLLESMPEFFKDVAALQAMSAHDKVNYVLTQSEARIQEKVAEQFKADLEKNALGYAKSAIRASAFLNDAVPRIRHAYAMGEKFDWALIDADLNASVDKKFNAVSKAWSAAKIGYNVYSDLNEKGGLEAFKNVSAQFYGAVAEYYIPGWGYFKLGKEMVEVLGNYVLSYATDTAVDGMLEVMFHRKSEPQVFAKWVMNKSPAALDQEITSIWDAGGGYGRLWVGQGSDKGDAEMKMRLRQELVAMRGAILAKKREEEQKQQQLTARIEQYLKAAKEAESSVKASARRAVDAGAAPLAQVRRFAEKVAGVRLEISKKNAEAAAQLLADQAALFKIRYIPIARGSVLQALDTALIQVTDSGTQGYDEDAFNAAMERYREVRKNAVASAYAQIDYNVANDGTRDLVGADAKVLASEEALAMARAALRARTRIEDLKALFTDLTAQLRQMEAQIATAQKALEQDKINNLHYPQAWREGYYMILLDPETDEGTNRREPGEVAREIQALQEARTNILEDAAAMPALYAREKELVANYVSFEQDMISRFRDRVPLKLQSVTALGGTRLGEANVSSDYVLGLNIFYAEGLAVKVDWRDFGGVLRLSGYYGPSRSSADYLEELARTAPLQTQAMLTRLEKRLGLLGNLVDEDQRAALFMTLLRRADDLPALRSVIYESNLSRVKDAAEQQVRMRAGKYEPYVAADESDAGVFLQQLRQEWLVFKPVAEKLVLLRKGIGKNIHYFGLDLKGTYFEVLDKFLSAPDRIRIYEEAVAQKLADNALQLTLSERYYLEWQEKFRAAQQNTMGYSAQSVQYLQVQSAVDSYTQLYTSRAGIAGMAPWVQKWTELQRQVVEAIKNARSEWDEREKLATLQDLQRKQEQSQNLAAAAASAEHDRKTAQDSVANLYKDFAATYQARNLRGLLRYMTDDWKASDGSDLRDLEDILDNSFRVFDRIIFVINGLNVQAAGDGRYNVSYSVTITGHINQMNLKHQETAQVEDTVVMTAGGPKIEATRGGRIWLKQ